MTSPSPRELLEVAAAGAAKRAETAVGIERWCPHRPTVKQQLFINAPEREVLYGGAASGGKSDALLMDHLQHAEVPGYAGLILRRTFADLDRPNAIMNRAGAWLRPTNAKWSAERKTWTFPSGATITFGHCEHEQDKYAYQGPEFTKVSFDELTQFTLTMYTYLQSRLRRVHAVSVPVTSRAGSNPGGVGHDWVYSRFVDPLTRDRAVFIAARAADNPHVNLAEYRESLALLDTTTRAQLEEGVWVRDSGGQLHRFDPKINVVDDLPALPYGAEWQYGLCIDLGASELVPTTAFSVVAWHQHSPIVYVVMSFKTTMMNSSDIGDEFRKLATVFSFEHVVVDQGGLGKLIISELNERWGIPAEGIEKSNKLGFRKLLNGALERGHVKIVKVGNEDLIAELLALQWNAAGTDAQAGQADHLSDSLLYNWRRAYAYSPTGSLEAPPANDSEAMERWAKDARARDERRRDKKTGTWWRR